jgi:hypothetical protein
MKPAGTTTLVFAAMLVLTSPATAQRFILQGNELFEACVTGVDEKDDTLHLLCSGYVWGVADTDTEFQGCTTNRQIHGREMREVVTNYVRAHPEHRDLPAAVQVKIALFSGFCPGRSVTIPGIVE